MTRLDALRRSVERLRSIAGDLPDDRLTARAYPSEWTIADVLSHLGSGAVLGRRRIADVLAGAETPAEVNQGVWDEWNAKAPAAQRADALDADAALLDALEAATPEQRARFRTSIGPMELDFDGFVGLRLNEHVLHTWDVEVAVDPAATLPADLAAEVAANLDLVARFTAKPTGDATTITVATPDGSRGLTVELGPEGATVSTAAPDAAGTPDVELDDDALVRLVYGRLDPGHTPPGAESAALATLRRVFPGF